MRIGYRADEQRFAVADATPRPQPGLRGAAIVLAAVIAILVDQTSTAIINTGLPYLQGVTAATPDEGSWIVTAFNAAYYAMILFSPWMMARCGRKALIVGALLGFSLASLVLFATSEYHVLVLLRFAQGAFLGCVFVPAAVLLFTSLPPAALRYAAPAFVFVSLGGSTLGTVIGGFFADEYGGSSVFLPGCLSTLATALLIFVTVRTKDKPQPDLCIDLGGLTLSVVAFGAMQYLANEGERRNWFDDSSIVLGAVVLALAFPSFVLYELRFTRHPHVNFRMFAEHRNLAVGTVINIAIGAVGYSVTLFVGYLQTILGATPASAGALVLVRVITYAVGVPGAFVLVVRRLLDIRAVVVLGALGSSCALVLFSRAITTTADLPTFVGLSLLFGLFFGMMNQPMGTLVVGTMPLPLLAPGVSIYKLTAPIGLMVGTGGMQAVLDHATAAFRSDITGQTSLARAPVEQFVQSHRGNPAGLAALVAAQAQTLSYAHVMLVFAAIVLAVIPVVFFAQVRAPTPVRADVR